jgi:predicted nucleotidyltransferase
MYFTPALSTLSNASAKVNTLNVHICTPIFQSAVTLEVSAVVEVEVESVAELLFVELELHLMSATMQRKLKRVKAIFFIL